ncbi:MAG: type III secretion system gatekeeper subunit SctW [Pseudomonadota bacterium]
MGIQTEAIGPTTGFDESTQTQGEKASSGAYQGREVKTINMTALAQDAMEELTTHSKLSEKSKKEADKRDVRSGSMDDRIEKLMELVEVEELLSKLGDLDKDKFAQALKALLEHKEGNPQKLRERTGQHFEEPAHQYALLKAYGEALKQQNASPEHIQAAKQALEQLTASEHGVDIRAALNIGEVTNQFAETGLADHQTLRNAYRENIKDYQDLNATLANLSQRLPGEKLEDAIAFITLGLSADLAVEGSSIDKEQLRLIINDMTWLKSSATILKNCELVMKKAHARGADPAFTAETLCKKIVSLQSASTVRHEQFAEILDDMGLTHDEL